MANRYYTLLVIPEKTSNVKRFLIPGWMIHGAWVISACLFVLIFMMLVDYWYVMTQIDQNRSLKLENQELEAQIKVYENKMETLEDTINRVQTFATRLKVITNTGERDRLVSMPNRKLPDSEENISQASRGAIETTTDVEEYGPEFRGRVTFNLKRALETESNLESLDRLLADQSEKLKSLPTIRPAQGFLTSGFGIKRSPYGGAPKMHEGIDIANQKGTSIQATAHGKVVFSGSKPGYGRTIVIDHGEELTTWYTHSQELLVNAGDLVSKGQTIAKMGNTGRTTGTHVHYEVRYKDIPLDPLDYLLDTP